MENQPKFSFGGEARAMDIAMDIASKSTSLKWYVDLDSKWPMWCQYVYLWCKRTIFRRPLE